MILYSHFYTKRNKYIYKYKTVAIYTIDIFKSILIFIIYLHLNTAHLKNAFLEKFLNKVY